MKTYRSAFPFRICAASRTQTGSVVGLSITTSHCLPFSASSWPLRSPISCSASLGSSPGWVLPRLKTVTLWPRLRAYWTWNGPVKPVPPRIKIRMGFAALPLSPPLFANPRVLGNRSEPPVMAESLRKVLLLVDISPAPEWMTWRIDTRVVLSVFAL